MTTGQRIKAARQKAGLTQQELADRLGIAYVGVSQWENNKRNPKYETLQRIAKALDVPVSALQENGAFDANELADAARKKDYSRYEQLLGYPKDSLFGTEDQFGKDCSNVIDWLLPSDLSGAISMRIISFGKDELEFMLDQLDSLEGNVDFDEKMRDMLRKAKYALYFISISSLQEDVLWMYGSIFSEEEIEAAIGAERKQELILKNRLDYNFSLLSIFGKREAVKRIEELSEMPKYKRKGDSDYKSGDTPPEGSYVCMQCGGTDPYTILVPAMCQKLPVCPKCGGRMWMKV